MPPGAGGDEGAECYLNTAGNCRFNLIGRDGCRCQCHYFERIKEELRKGRTHAAGGKPVFPRLHSILTPMTTLIAAAVLFQFAQGPVRGFAVTLSVGILVSMFTAIVLTRYLLRQAAGTALRLRRRAACGRRPNRQNAA